MEKEKKPVEGQRTVTLNAYKGLLHNKNNIFLTNIKI